MDNPLLCPQCGGQVRIERPQVFASCPFCASALWIDKARVVFHWYIASTLDEAQARAVLTRWMAGRETASGFGRRAEVRSVDFSYFPMWLVRVGGEGEESLEVEPAAATSVTELKELRIPAGEMRKYDTHLDLPVQAPSVPLEKALQGSNAAITGGKVRREASLVHVPVYTFKYEFRGGSYTAIVEGSTGTVFASTCPARRRGPYNLVAASTVLAYTLLALSRLSRGEPWTLGAVAVQALLSVTVTLGLFLWASWVARD